MCRVREKGVEKGTEGTADISSWGDWEEWFFQPVRYRYGEAVLWAGRLLGELSSGNPLEGLAGPVERPSGG